MNPRDNLKTPRPRTTQDIINDILSCRYGESTLESYLGVHIEINQSQPDPELNKEIYGVDNPLPDMINLRAVLRKLTTNSASPPDEKDEKSLSRAFETLGMLIAHDLDESTYIYDEDEPQLIDAPKEEYRKTIKKFQTDAMRNMDVSFNLQNFFVELCDHYNIPTKRNPPQRKRS